MRVEYRGEQLGVAKPAAPPFPPSLGTQTAEVFKKVEIEWENHTACVVLL